MRSFVVPVSCSSLLFFCFSPCLLLSFVSVLFLLSGVCWLDGGGAAGSCPRAGSGPIRMQRKMEISSKEWLGLPFWLLMVRLNYLPGLADFGNQVHAELPKEAGAPRWIHFPQEWFCLRDDVHVVDIPLARASFIRIKNGREDTKAAWRNHSTRVTGQAVRVISECFGS